MENYATQLEIIKKGQCLTERQLESLGIIPTNIDCFQFSHFLLYAKDEKRLILQPLPYNQYKVIRVYNYVEATATVLVD